NNDCDLQKTYDAKETPCIYLTQWYLPLLVIFRLLLYVCCSIARGMQSPTWERLCFLGGSPSFHPFSILRKLHAPFVRRRSSLYTTYTKEIKRVTEICKIFMKCRIS